MQSKLHSKSTSSLRKASSDGFQRDIRDEKEKAKEKASHCKSTRYQ